MPPGSDREEEGGLTGEEEQWLLSLKTLETLIENVLGDILLSSAFIAYLSPCEQSLRWTNEFMLVRDSLDDDPHRAPPKCATAPQIIAKVHRMVKEDHQLKVNGCLAYWKRLLKEKKIPFSKGYMFHRTMGDTLKIQEWLTLGLPKDPHSIDNAVIIRNSNRSLSLRGRWFINIGSKNICYHKNFRLYITSGISEPQFNSDVYAMFTIINFSVSKEGLEDQLLSVAVSMTKPQVEEEWMLLISTMDENRKRIKKVEDDVLSILSSVTGNILDSESAVSGLDSAKVLSTELLAELKKHELTKMDIDMERSCYKNLADHASKVYFSLDDMPSVNPMYHFSLEWFVNVFRSSILSSIQESVKLVSLERLSENFTFTFYSAVCRSILQEDKLLFSFLLALSLARSMHVITPEELEFLATGGTYLGFLASNPAKDWLADESWRNILRFLSRFKANKTLWEEIYLSHEPQVKTLPSPWEKRLNHFQKLLLFRALRPDKLHAKEQMAMKCNGRRMLASKESPLNPISKEEASNRDQRVAEGDAGVKSAVEEFIKSQLGPRYLSAPGFNILESFALSKKTTPLLMILSHGVNPLLDIIDFASSQDIHAELQTVPIGFGQGHLVELALRDAQLKGQWVCLENVHLAGPWMATLEDIVCSIPGDSAIEDGFRLWLTSLPCQVFPQSIVQRSVKLVKEAPSGLKRNLLQSFTTGPIAESSFYANYRDKDSILRRYMFSLCFFHALIIERGKFGPIGWNEAYDFGESDLHISLKQMEVLLSGCDETPYDSIRYLIGECNYGGRVTDDLDRLTLATILSDLIHPNIENEYYPSLTKTGPPFHLPVGGSYGDYITFIQEGDFYVIIHS
ncbi:dynein axonemal heavy chain 7-like [Hetaerina americana]|uniref:dynein axonemal heavy chain 7-like n=1 Tax=Hetaerina americana TaxID=62018 RepID=UPI003A7F2C02